MTTFLINPSTGSIDTATNWRNELGAEFEAARLEEIKAEPLAQAELTNRVFSGWWGDAKDGEEYIEEWEEHYETENGQNFTAIYHFTNVRGKEGTAPDDMPWSEDHIWMVKTTY